MTRRARIHLVRHGEASAKWTEAHDPGLSRRGQAQSVEAANLLEPLGPLPVFSSPLRRARETAAPTAERWGANVGVIPDVAELPSPGVPLADRQNWLFEIMAKGWNEVGAPQREWRSALVAALLAQDRDCAIFSHFVAINAAVGAATGEDRVILFRPANASITVFETDGERLFLIERGEEATTVVR